MRGLVPHDPVGSDLDDESVNPHDREHASDERFCHSPMSSITASVTQVRKSFDTATPAMSPRWPWISEQVIPPAYIEMILSSNPSKWV